MSTRWKGTIAVEGEPTVDGRVIAPGAITFEFLPIPLLRPERTIEVAAIVVQRRAERCGEVEMIQRGADGALLGTGWIEDEVLIELLTSADFPDAALGVGIELDEVTSAIQADELLTIESGRLRGVQITSAPAFESATIRSVA